MTEDNYMIYGVITNFKRTGHDKTIYNVCDWYKINIKHKS